MTIYQIPDTLKKNILSIYAQDNKGLQWLDSLSKQIEVLAKTWDLHDLKTLPNLTFNYVLSGVQKIYGSPPIMVILKLSPELNDVQTEYKTLEHFQNQGITNAVRVLGFSPDNHALLLEKAHPGTSLKSYFPEQEDKATQIACDLFKSFHMTSDATTCNTYADTAFSYLTDWLQVLDKPFTSPFPFDDLITLAKCRVKKLSIQSQSKDWLLLHGDLHHDNILNNHASNHPTLPWTFIDPKGVIGDKTYNVVAFILNPVDALAKHTDAQSIISKRITTLSQALNLSAPMLLDWCFVHAMMAACWCLEDALDATHWIKLATITQSLFDNAPTIETKRLLLRPWQEADFPAFAAMNQDPRVMEHFPSTLSESESKRFFDRYCQHFKSYGFGLFATILKETNHPIGFVGLNVPLFTSDFTPCVEIGWRLASQYWHKGYATEAAKAVLNYGFNELNLNEIVSFTVPKNIASRKVMEKIGLTQDLDGNFNHPALSKDHPLSEHVLYRRYR